MLWIQITLIIIILILITHYTNKWKYENENYENIFI